MKFHGNIKESLLLATIDKQNSQVLNEKLERSLMVLWFESGTNEVLIDDE
ncbi:MAG: AraC family transcriptional regulator, partial [Flavobacteriales bacterium]|nr:AraC family transcriptional regulator [Flavobacteriales bacterium]